jgi:hypothetical protein
MNISPDDANVGDVITVISPKININCRSLQGQPLKILAVHIPFIIVFGPRNKRIVLDLREVNIRKVSKEYADQFCSQDFEERINDDLELERKQRELSKKQFDLAIEEKERILKEKENLLKKKKKKIY